ncbi:MAG: methyltransferase domain-containing protein [Halobacteriaceae archaeon]
MYVLELAGEDDAFAAAEATTAATGVSVFAAGLARCRGLSGRARTLAFTHRASELLGRTDADVESARSLLAAATLDRTGSVAVRARDVRSTTGVDTRRAERELGSALVERGFSVDLEDPDHELRALFSAADGGAVCALGWLELATERGFAARAPTDRPFFQPGSMDPMLARALVNFAGARPGAAILDPMCGTGGVLVEAGLVGARALGNDAQRKMVRGARENLREYLGGDFAVVRGDATRLPFRDGAVDGVVFDAPYGRQSKVETHSLADLVRGALAEARRVSRGRCVLVADRRWDEAVADAGWSVESAFERRVHRSLTRHVLVLA